MQHITKDSLLDGIQLFRVHTAAELLATVRMLPTMLEADPKVGYCHFAMRSGPHGLQMSMLMRAPRHDAGHAPKPSV